MKYKNKNYDLPVIIEAEQYSPDKPCAEVYPTTAEDPAYLIIFLRGKSIWNRDWVAQDYNGKSFYRIKNDLFMNTYEPLKEGE